MSTTTGTYFEQPSVDNIMDNTTAMSGMGSNSSSSISPTERVDLTDPQTYFISSGSAYLMTDYDSCAAHTYSALNPPGMVYVPSSPEEQQFYLTSHETFGTTPSPTPTINSSSFHQFGSNLPFKSSSKELNSEELDFYSDGSNYDYNRPMFNYRPSCSPNDSLSSMEATPIVHSGDRHRGIKRTPDSTYHYSKQTASSHRYHDEALEKKNGHVKRHSQNKTKKRCSNCHTPQSPSWRRSISKPTKGDLLCNACGLYEKTAKRKRMLVTQDDGVTKVVRKRDVRRYICSRCGSNDATRWRKCRDLVQCEKCIRGRR